MRGVMMIGAALAAMSGPALAAPPFDGLYKGGNHVAGGPPRCKPSYPFNIRVKNNVFVWNAENDRVNVTVGPDGTFQAQSGDRFLSGRIANGAMTGTTKGGANGCQYAWSLQKG